VRGIIVLECVLYALLLSALFIPVRLAVRMTASLRDGRGEAAARWLLFSMRAPLFLSVSGMPPMTLEILRKDGTTHRKLWPAAREKEPGPWERAVLAALRIRRARIDWTFGIEGEPAMGALLCGLLGTATEELFVMLGERVEIGSDAIRVSVNLAERQDALLLNLEGIGSVRAADIMERRWRMRRDARRTRPQSRPPRANACADE